MFLNEQYVDSLYAKDADLERVKTVLAERGMPDISVAEGYGRLLTMLVRLKGADSVLEIGALGGYSGICLARGMGEEGKLVSLELLQHYADVAKANMEAAGLGGKVEYLVGDAKASLARLAAEGRKFDFFFIDADKEGYPVYLDYAMELAKPGALIVGDNIFLRGRTIDDAKQGPAVRAVRSFNERIATDERLLSTVIPGYDGLAIAIVK
ncbi:O-methyltransferase [Paenibacillus harenae]|uniref:O-methyltransferase YrrM n=1 Tax=Paenibacillus harenae TaxID=306543 RepID=A0ABT9TXK8_PAEHA|nr:O-methyltransferase [Paenibacillus harenae]MDQ0111807.1 putative O-methyltransferase YrrM [Paenibacillus harenae]